MPDTHPHRWTFFRAGRLDQVRLDTGDDLTALEGLDQKLWVALSCPTRGLEFDPATLEALDTDHDGRIRVPELLAAIRWASGLLKDRSVLVTEGEALPIAAIDNDGPDGAPLVAAACEVLAGSGRPDADAVTPAEVAAHLEAFAKAPFNGDGLLPVAAVEDPGLAAVLQAVIDTQGALPDATGAACADKAKIEAFFADIDAFATWWSEGEGAALPLGDATPAAFSAFRAVQAKVADWFARCRLAVYDPRSAPHLNHSDAEYVALAPHDLSTLGPEVESLPLAQVTAGASLPLGSGVNPAWADRVAAFRDAVVTPILGEGRTEISEAEWRDLAERFARYAAWTDGKKGASVEALGIARVREIQAAASRAALDALLDRDLARADERAALERLYRLALYRRDLVHLSRNYVSFADFYARDRKAIFQAGTLYLDGRSCDLCLYVDNPAAHAGLAALGRLYIAYCDCKRPGGQTTKIAAAFTRGDSDYLMVGRNGVFYDRKGLDWDATITRVIEQPISLWQAFWSPYKKFLRLIEQQIEKMASAREKAVQDKAAAKVATTGDSVGKPPDKPAASFDIAKYAGIFAAIGLAVGVLGAAIGMVVSAFARLTWWQVPIAIAAVVLVLMLIISTPSVIIAWLKLRQRTLGPLLDANGWAVNGRVRITKPLGTFLTQVRDIPEGSRRIRKDVFVDRAARRNRILFVLLLLLVAGAFVAWFALRDRPEAPGVEPEPVAEEPVTAP
ncbi:MAG: hypothetical protein JXB39_06935 [Deltaproteobacteria bacterium]|nr:hypothetical protein [Deltaproteobacteria bacterium]